MNHSPFVEQIFQNPAVALEKTTIDHNGAFGTLGPVRHRRVWYQKGFRVTATRQRWHFLRHDIGSETCDFASPAGQDPLMPSTLSEKSGVEATMITSPIFDSDL
jgi:hypothetical protein